MTQNPPAATAQLNSAQEAYRQLRLDEALAGYTRLLEVDPTHYDAQVGVARTLIRQRHQAEALTAAQRAVELDPQRHEGHAALAVLYFLTDDLDKAEAAVQRAIALAPGEPEPHLTQAQIHADRKAFEAAHTELDAAREQILLIAEDDLRQEMLAFAAHTETYLLLAEGKGEDARGVAQSVIALEEANPHAACLAYSNLGILEARARRYGPAVEYLERAFEMNPYLEGAGTTLGRLLILRGEPARAAEVLAKLLENPCVHGGAPHLAYGMALARTGRRQEALAQYRQALDEGLRGSNALVARWQLIWLSNTGRVLIIGLALAGLAAWLIWGNPSSQVLTLLVMLVVIIVLQQLWNKGRQSRS